MRRRHNDPIIISLKNTVHTFVLQGMVRVCSKCNLKVTLNGNGKASVVPYQEGTLEEIKSKAQGCSLSQKPTMNFSK